MAEYIFTKEDEGFSLVINGGEPIAYINGFIAKSETASTLAIRIENEVYVFKPAVDSITINGVVFTGTPSELWASLNAEILDEQQGGGEVPDGAITEAKLSGDVSDKLNAGDKDVIYAASEGFSGNGTTYNNTAFTNLIAKLSTKGSGRVIIPPGVYKLNTYTNTTNEATTIFQIPANTIIEAYGAEFVTDAAGVYGFSFQLLDNSKWFGGKLTKGCIETRGSNIEVKDVRAEFSRQHSFHLNSGKSNDPEIINKLYENVSFANCVSYRSERYGFALHRSSVAFSGGDAQDLGNFKRIRFTNCHTIEPSYIDGGSWFSQYDCGFAIEDILSAEEITFDGCTSSGAPSAGFHLESDVNTQGVLFINCEASDNGNYESVDNYPFGFMYKSGFTFINCKGENNPGGLFGHLATFQGDDYQFINCGDLDAETFSHVKGVQNKEFRLDIPAHGGIAGGLVYTAGSFLFPVSSINRRLFDFAVDTVDVVEVSGTVSRNIPYIYNSDVVYSTSRETTISSVPIRVTPDARYKINITAKELSGTTGNAVLYIQEFDEDFQLIKRGQNYILKKTLSEITTDWTDITLTIGKDASFPSGATSVHANAELYQKAKYIRVSICLADASDADKSYGISKFEVLTLPVTSYDDLTDKPATTQTVYLGADVSNTGVQTLADVTGLQFPVSAGKSYWFKFTINYTVDNTAVGTGWSINGPSATNISFDIASSLNNVGKTFTQARTGFEQVTYGATSTTANAAGQRVEIEGWVTATASGNVVARFAPEETGTLTAKGKRSFVDYRELPE